MVGCGGNHRCNWYHALLVAAYREAREAYETARENACMGYTTEISEYPPGPTFKQFLMMGIR